MTLRMTSREIRQWVTPFVMRFLHNRITQGKRTVTLQELLSAGLHQESVRALIQTKRIQAIDSDGVEFEITLDT